MTELLTKSGKSANPFRPKIKARFPHALCRSWSSVTDTGISKVPLPLGVSGARKRISKTPRPRVVGIDDAVFAKDAMLPLVLGERGISHSKNLRTNGFGFPDCVLDLLTDKLDQSAYARGALHIHGSVHRRSPHKLSSVHEVSNRAKHVLINKLDAVELSDSLFRVHPKRDDRGSGHPEKLPVNRKAVNRVGKWRRPLSGPWSPFVYLGGLAHLGKRVGKTFTGVVWASDGSAEDIQAIHDSGLTQAGDIITVPAGDFGWAVGVAFTKGIHLQGAGSGRVVARSRTVITFGTGTQVFTIQDPDNGLPIDALVKDLAPGTVVRVWRETTNKDTAYMLGTITSLVGTTLTLNITENTGSGPMVMWLIATEHVTKVTHNAGASVLLSLTEDTAGSVEVSGIQFTTGTGTGSLMHWNYTASGQPLLIHDCWWNQSHTAIIIDNLGVNRGVMWNCSVTWTFYAESPHQWFHCKPIGRTESWANLSTMGDADTDGKQNIYIEDCDVHGNGSAACDFDENTRLVWRYNLNDHASLNSHGRDSSSYGVRHVEYYRNRFEFANFGEVDGTLTINVITHILLRGGTGAIHHNYIERIFSPSWGDGSEFIFGIYILGLGWSNDDGGVPEYHAPRQFGFGRVTGLGIDGHGNPTENGVYVGDLEPLYIYLNTGDVVNVALSGGTVVLPNPDDPADYIREGIEYINDGTAKPGYSEFEYPHPLRAGPDDAAPTMITPPVETADAEVGGTWDTDEGTVSGSPTPTLTITIHECTGP